MFMVPADSEDIAAEYQVLLGELEAFNPELLHKDKVLAISKCDLLETKELTKLKKKLKVPVPTIFISAASYMNIDELKDILYTSITKANKPVME